MVMKVLLLHNMVKAVLFWVVLKFRKYSPRPGVEYTHHPMHCKQTAVHTPAQLAVHAPHAGGTKYTPKTVVVFTDGDLYHLAYNHTLHDRARPVSGRLWIMQFWRHDAVMLASCMLAPGMACHWVECFDFCWDYRFHVYSRSVRYTMQSKRLFHTAPKVCLRTNLGSRFIVCGFSSDPYLTANPNENWRHNLQRR
jgi:hypothetical protein